MRKTQVALAALALMASTAALAEVKISGVMDVGIGRTSGNGGVGGVYVTNGAFVDHSAIELDALVICPNSVNCASLARIS